MDFDLNVSSLGSGDDSLLDENMSWSQISMVLCSQPPLSSPTQDSVLSFSPTQQTNQHTQSTTQNDSILSSQAMEQPSLVEEDGSMPPPLANAKQPKRGKKKQVTEKACRKKLAKEKIATNHSNWSLDEVRILADAMEHYFKEQAESKGVARIMSRNDKWGRVAELCEADGVNRTPLQCMDKWENIFPKFKRIRDWNKAIPSGLSSWEQMDADEREARTLPKHFDERVYLLLEQRFANDKLVNPGPIMVDSSHTSYNKCNPSTLHEEESNADVEDPSSTGKRRGSGQSRSRGIKRDFQDISTSLLEAMERTTTTRLNEQKKHVQDLLTMQERQAKAAEDQVVVLQQSISKLTDFLGAYLARQD